MKLQNRELLMDIGIAIFVVDYLISEFCNDRKKVDCKNVGLELIQTIDRNLTQIPISIDLKIFLILKKILEFFKSSKSSNFNISSMCIYIRRSNTNIILIFLKS